VGLRFDPVGGGQFKQVVSQIMEAESQPIKALQKKKSNEEARLKLFNEFKSKFSGLDKAMAELGGFRKFRELKVDLGDGSSLVSVTIDKEKAEPGQYSIEISDIAARTSIISNGFDDPNDNVLGMGFITLKSENGGSVDVYVDDKDSSLNGIASVINRNSDSPVRASVIKDATDPDTPWKLLLTAKKDGLGFQVETPDFNFMDGSKDLYVDDSKDAKNAEVVLDGFPVEVDSNDINDFLPGVNLHLKQARPDQPFIISITEDVQKMAGKMKGLVENLNQVMQFIVKQNTIDQTTDTSNTFAGDGTLQTFEYRLRNILHQGFTIEESASGRSSVMFLSQLGVEFDKTGSLSFKEDKFNKALEKDFDLVAQALAGPTGLVNQLRGFIDSYMRSGSGVFQGKEKGIHSRIDSIDQQIEQKTNYLDKKRESLVSQFSRLEATIGNMQRQQQYLSATLPGAGSGGSVISQLLGG